MLEHMQSCKVLGKALLRGMATGLGLEETWFETEITQDPTLLFRIFHYPPHKEIEDFEWGVGEHTDYGLITLLAQDACGGLQVKVNNRSQNEWINVPSIPGAIVVNIGDMLERLTCGLYKSTPHRVRNTSGKERLSFPLFFDPSWDARVPILHQLNKAVCKNESSAQRWDGENTMVFEGTYGEYLTKKISKVFPELFDSIQ